VADPSVGLSGDGEGRLQRCIRDLAALNALPSLCVGKDTEAAFAIVLEALPTALSCDLLYVKLPESPAREGGSLHGRALSEAQLAEIALVTAADADGASAQIFLEGGTFWCLEAEIPIGARRGRLVAGCGVPLDPSTDRILVRTAANIVGTILETANVLEGARRKDDFLAMLGHELRNPLAPITTAVELLARHPQVAREKQVIERHARHLTRLVDDLLDISRVSRGEVHLRKEHVTLASILERAIEMASALISRQGHELRVTDPGDVTLQGDPIRLGQVFGNLLTNAAKFTPPGGQIDVLVDRSPGRVQVTVRDTGCGIAREQRDRIFEPFVQADRERDALRGGLGLGLAIVKNLVQGHGGIISVQSEGKGRGAAFTVDLPAAARAEPPRELAKPEPLPSRSNVRVLVVDDNVDVAELLSEALQEQGFQTAVAYDGQDALDRWRGFRPHAGVLDVGLPDVDGYELAKTLRTEFGRNATLIAATGYGQPADRRRAAEAGFDCYLIKPVSVKELVIVLDEHVLSSGEDSSSSG